MSTVIIYYRKMSIYFRILYIFIVLKHVQSADLNVGTTLFTKADTYKECWSGENIALLTSRMILEDLLPNPSILVIDCNEFVTDLVEYFRLILETVRRDTHGKTKHITLVALTDLLGGYLHHAVLPIAKYSYYAGLIDCDSMYSLIRLYEELKLFLRTNGQGWAKPLEQNTENFEVQKLNLQPPTDDEICKNLIVLEPDPTGKIPCDDILIPLPFFDSESKPSAVALPTKTSPLHNLEVNSSSYLLMKFFVSSYRCLLYKNVKSQNMHKFEQDVCTWIEKDVLPRLDDEKFYAAFGGILRIRYTFRRQDVSQMEYHKTHDLQSELENSDEPHNTRMSRQSMILMAVLITIGVWFILGTSFICYKMRATRQKQCPDDGPDGQPTLDSSKYFYPEPPKHPKNSRGTSTPDTDATSASDMDMCNQKKRPPGESMLCAKLNKWSRHKSSSKPTEIIITNCRCHDDDDSAVIDSNHTERRLPSITEMAEQSNSEQNSKSTRGKKITFPTNQESSTADSGSGRHAVRQDVYDDESESEVETGDTE